MIEVDLLVRLRRNLILHISRCVTGEDEVVSFGGFVAARLVHRLIGRFAVGKIGESPAASRTLETIEELRQALLTFRETYNTTWLVQRHGFVTPAQHRQQQLQLLAKAA
jgi:hypothetical protein